MKKFANMAKRLEFKIVLEWTPCLERVEYTLAFQF